VSKKTKQKKWDITEKRSKINYSPTLAPNLNVIILFFSSGPGVEENFLLNQTLRRALKWRRLRKDKKHHNKKCQTTFLCFTPVKC
jgi:hypothetical protein